MEEAVTFSICRENVRRKLEYVRLLKTIYLPWNGKANLNIFATFLKTCWKKLNKGAQKPG